MIAEQHHIDESLEPVMLRGLDESQKSQLTELLDAYLIGLEQGNPPSPEQLCQQHPDLADALKIYLEQLQQLYGLTTPPTEHSASDYSTGRQLDNGKSFNGQSFHGKAQVDNAPGQLGDFILQREIGRGGMGIVYQSHQTSLNRTVAIKLLPLASTLNPHQITRFHNEAHAAGLLQHENIVPVYSVGVEQGIHFYAMQFIDGESIDKWIEDRRLQGAQFKLRAANAHGGRLIGNSTGDSQMPAWRPIVSWAAQVADALQAAHEAGIVHRDIKPSNLLLDKHGKIWITDFGLARVVSDVSLTATGDLLGTMRYMSPEQARGESALVDGRCDIYSLAATTYEMLALRPLHEGSEAATLLRAIDAHQLTPLRSLRRGLPVDLETVLSKALSKSRDDRYQTAQEMADDLRRVLAGQPTQARPPSMLDRLSQWSVKHRQAVLTTLAVGFLALVGLTIGMAMLAAEKRKSDDNARRSDRNAQLARTAVDELGSQIAELLAEVPAAENVRRRLLSQTLAYHQRFASAAGSEPALSEDLAITFGKIGLLNSQLGDLAESLDALHRSEQLYQQLAISSPTNLDYQLSWSIAQNNLAEALQRSGKVEEAAQFFAAAIQRQRDLLAKAENVIATAAATPNDWTVEHRNELTSQLATSLNNLGLLFADAEAADKAEALFQQAIDLMSALPTLASSSTASSLDRSKLLMLQTNLSATLAQTDPARAIVLSQETLRAQLEDLERNASDVKLATQTIATLNALGRAQGAKHQPAAAVTTFRQAIAIAEQLLQRSPDYPVYQRDLALSLNHLGLACSRMDDLPAAQSAFERAHHGLLRLTQNFPRDAELQSMLGGVLNNLGFLYQQLGDNALAVSSYRSAVVAQETAVNLAPEVLRYRQFLRKHLANLQPLEADWDAT